MRLVLGAVWVIFLATQMTACASNPGNLEEQINSKAIQDGEDDATCRARNPQHLPAVYEACRKELAADRQAGESWSF